MYIYKFCFGEGRSMKKYLNVVSYHSRAVGLML